MLSGSCLCGDIKIAYEGEPALKALCHCNGCKKQSGSVFSSNIVVPDNAFKLISGTPKTYIKENTASGNKATNFFCGSCGTTLWLETPTVPDTKIIKVGVMDDMSTLSNAKPGAEMFSPNRVDWVPQAPNAAQLKTMA
ncbi:hypothetical protein NA57DRAFT_44934 [Rhizodiscina lignyota]|uniref:CENP-V/GFA domain-containing protein n=1 Tax=Rhizodiscina lignyota TaxID=1504668 RepID=A0A9P4M1W2_9PEZI|nr:hypothetical protein NA57DRAFT_44934 [Rhizodiscina lignyota]